jgi:hypothetical protein
MVFGVSQLGFRTLKRRLRRDSLRLQACDLGIGSDGIGLAAYDIRGRGIELRARARDRGLRGDDGVA